MTLSGGIVGSVAGVELLAGVVGDGALAMGLGGMTGVIAGAGLTLYLTERGFLA